MASIGDGMSVEMRHAIRAKHKLVEQMKEEVTHPEDHKANHGLWKVIIITASILLLFLAVHQMATAERASRGNRSDSHKLNKFLDPNLSLTREEGRRWTSERLLRHFTLRRLSQVRWTQPVYTLAELWEAVADPDTHIITVEVAYSVVQRRTLKGPTWVNRPIIQTSSYVNLGPDGLDFDQLLRHFIKLGSRKGLHVVFRDPRVVEPVMAALDVEMDYGRLKSPLILEAEILPGPGGFLPELSCVMTNPASYPGGYPPRSVRAAQIASLTDGTVVPFDPMTFVASAFKHVPGAILSIGVASHAPCTNEEALNQHYTEQPGQMTAEQELAEAAALSGPDLHLAGVISETAKLLGEGAVPAGDVNQPAPANRRRHHRRLAQLDAINPGGDSAALAGEMAKLAEDAVEMVLMGNEGMSPHGYGGYDVKASAEILTPTMGYSWNTGRDVLNVLHNGSWTGEVYFPVSGCVLAESSTGYLRELLSTKLGWAVILRGAVLFTADLRAVLLRELDTSRTFLASDFVQLPDGEPLTEKEVFVRPVLGDVEAMAGLTDEGRAARNTYAAAYKQRNPREGKIENEGKASSAARKKQKRG